MPDVNQPFLELTLAVTSAEMSRSTLVAWTLVEVRRGKFSCLCCVLRTRVRTHTDTRARCGKPVDFLLLSDQMYNRNEVQCKQILFTL